MNSSLSSSQSWGAGTSSGTSYLPMYVESHVAGNDSAGTFVFNRNEESDSGIDDVGISRNFVLFVGRNRKRGDPCSFSSNCSVVYR